MNLIDNSFDLTSRRIIVYIIKLLPFYAATIEKRNPSHWQEVSKLWLQLAHGLCMYKYILLFICINAVSMYV